MAEKPPKVKIPKNEKLHKRADHTPFRPSAEDLKLRELYQGPLAFQRELAKELKRHDGKMANQTEFLRGIYARLRSEERRLKGGATAESRASAAAAYRARLEATIEGNKAEHARLQEALATDSAVDVEKDDETYDPKLIAKKRKQADELEAFKLRAAETQAEYDRIKGLSPEELARHSQRRLAEVQNALDYLDIFDGLRDHEEDPDRDIALEKRNFATKAYTKEVDKFWGSGTKTVDLKYKPEGHLFRKQMAVEGPLSNEAKEQGIRVRTAARAAGAPYPGRGSEGGAPRSEAVSLREEAAANLVGALEGLIEGAPDKKKFQAALDALVDGVAKADGVRADGWRERGAASKAAEAPFLTALVVALMPGAGPEIQAKMEAILTKELGLHRNVAFGLLPGTGKYKEFLRGLPMIARAMRHAVGMRTGLFAVDRKIGNFARDESWLALRGMPDIYAHLNTFHERAKRLKESVPLR